VLFLTIALNVVTVIMIPKGSFPSRTPAHLAACASPQDSSFPAMNESVQKIVDVIKKDPAVQNVMAFTEAACHQHSNIFIALKPLTNAKSPRRRSSTVAPAAQPPPGRLHFPSSFPDLRIADAQLCLYQTPCNPTMFPISPSGPRMLRR